MAQAESSARRIKLTGARFNGGRLPVDSLVELERYQELLRIVARSSWRQDHPGEDLPADFDDEVSLTIESIEEGSADVMLAFERHAVYQEYQRQADDTVSDMIAASYESRELPEFPAAIASEVRERIVLLGTSLEAGQSIEVYTAGPSNPPIEITIESRREVVQTFALEDFISAPMPDVHGELQSHSETIVGRITEIDAEKATFRFESLRHGRLIGHYDAEGQLFDDIRSVLDSPAEAPILRVEGQLQYKRDGSPWRFTETYAVEQFVPGSGSWAERLIELAQLSTGWADSDNATPVAVVALEATNALMQAISDAGRQLPSFYRRRRVASSSSGRLSAWYAASR
ncbi:hypothetical protein QCD70_01065 [Agreia sp. PsM10]|uniref:hypothetical protein n=1 Tax=Agreia sp. PsM10 TaxID=3030533 RepID=UPI00263BA3F0|nr:hypothetical protein [Agreia sp. PsM10]MDN4638823.1 hypothetical protein [Agreia sp. PsM10]